MLRQFLHKKRKRRHGTQWRLVAQRLLRAGLRALLHSDHRCMLYLICSAILGALCLLACRITRQRQLSSSKCALRALTAQKNRRALIVIAHPDDEAMFFVPTIQSCSAAGLTVELLCLSDGAVPRGCVRGRACGIISHHFAGNAYGLGTQRQVELARSCAILQLVPPSIVVDEELQVR